MKRELILINRDGKEEFTLPPIPHASTHNAWVWHAGRWWGFAVGMLDGKQYYYEQIPRPGDIKEAA